MTIFDVIKYPIPDEPENPNVKHLPEDIREEYERLGLIEWGRHMENYGRLCDPELFKKYRSILRRLLLEYNT